MRFSELPSRTNFDFAQACLGLQQNGDAGKRAAYPVACIDLGFADKKLVDELFDDFVDYCGNAPVLFSGAVDTLSVLSQSYRLGLVSIGRTKGAEGENRCQWG